MPETAQHRPPLLVEKHVRSLDGPVHPPEFVEIGQGGEDGGALAGYDGSRLTTDIGKAPPGQTAQRQPVRPVGTSVQRDQTDHARMGAGPQGLSLGGQPDPVIFAFGRLDDQTVLEVDTHTSWITWKILKSNI